MSHESFDFEHLIPGLFRLRQQSLGDAAICIAVLDGPVDQSHPCFDGANLSADSGENSLRPGNGRMTSHGTHVSSIIFGQIGSPLAGIAPGCRGLLVPIFSDEQTGATPQGALASAIQRAVELGAHVINISGGELSRGGESDRSLAEAIRTCADRNVLVVAAAGNDSCECLHVPAALPTVLAVGAMDELGMPLPMTNWGGAYLSQGILAPGKNIPGAVPGGGIGLRTGTSFATPIVSGVAGLLLSLQHKQGEPPNAAVVRNALLQSATRCDSEVLGNCDRFMVGALNIPNAIASLFSGVSDMSDKELVTLAADSPTDFSVKLSDSGVVACEAKGDVPLDSTNAGLAPSHAFSESASKVEPTAVGVTILHDAPPPRASIVPSDSCSCGGAKSQRQLVYALGTIGYDFGTEARRDSFKQLMPSVVPHKGEGLIAFLPVDPDAKHETIFPPNPYDARQMVNYLCGLPRPEPPFPTEAGLQRLNYSGQTPPSPRHGNAFPPAGGLIDGNEMQAGDLSEASQLIWTLNIELTPIYAIRPSGTFADVAYLRLVQALAGQVRPKDDDYYVSRVSIPGVLTGETVRLYSGQVVPVLRPQPRGMYAWSETRLVNDSLDAIGERIGLDVRKLLEVPKEERMRIAAEDTSQGEDFQRAERAQRSLRNFLNKIYYELRNLGQAPADRALNYAATNAFQAATLIEGEAVNDTQLDTIVVERSAFCRMDSDCWDVRLRFFDPADVRRARTVHRFTIDVSDVFPVSVGEIRTWEVAI